MARRAPHERVRSQLVPRGSAHLHARKKGATLCGLKIPAGALRLEPGEPGKTCVACRNRWGGKSPLRVKRRVRKEVPR